MERETIDGHLINYSSSSGYPTIWLNNKNTLVHRYVWEKYNGKIPDGFEVHHKDKNRKNFSLDNLFLVSKIEHHRNHALENKLGHFNKGKPKLHVSGFCGEARKIIAIKNNYILRFNSISEAARVLNTRKDSILRVLNGTRKQNFGWRFIYA